LGDNLDDIVQGLALDPLLAKDLAHLLALPPRNVLDVTPFGAPRLLQEISHTLGRDPSR
jgi:hypothetical protein